MNSLELFALNNFPLVEPGDDLPSIIFDSIKNNKLIINDNDIVVIAQKIVSKAENRYVNLKTIEISEEAKDLSKKLNKDEGLVQAIINESNRILSTKKNVIIIKNLVSDCTWSSIISASIYIRVLVCNVVMIYSIWKVLCRMRVTMKFVKIIISYFRTTFFRSVDWETV
mgnify:CR=1 FL=1